MNKEPEVKVLVVDDDSPPRESKLFVFLEAFPSSTGIKVRIVSPNIDSVDIDSSFLKALASVKERIEQRLINTAFRESRKCIPDPDKFKEFFKDNPISEDLADVISGIAIELQNAETKEKINPDAPVEVDDPVDDFFTELDKLDNDEAEKLLLDFIERVKKSDKKKK